jgi:hypothetical protein
MRFRFLNEVGSGRLRHVLERALAVALFVPILAAGGEVPPYPYGDPPDPPWVPALREKLEAPLSFEFKDVPLREALEDLSARTGVKIRLAPEVEPSAKKRVTVSYKDQAGKHVLQNLLASEGLSYEFSRNAEELVVRKPDRTETPETDALRAGRRIESLRRRHFPTPEEKEEKAKSKETSEALKKAVAERKKEQRRALAATKISQDFVGESLEVFLRALCVATKANLAVDSKVDAKALKVTVKGGSRPASIVLDEVLGSLGLGYKEMDGVWLITTARNAQEGGPLYLRIWKEEYEAAKRKILALRLTKELPGTRVCEFSEALAADLGVKVFPDRQAWGSEVKFPRKTVGQTVKQLAALLKTKGIELVVDVSPHNFSRALPRSVAELPKKPADVPDVEWAIYLFGRKK